MTYKRMMMCAVLAGTMQNAWGIGEKAPLDMLNTMVSEHSAVCASEEFQDVMLSIAMFRKNLKKSNNPDMTLVSQAVDGLMIEFQAALEAYQNKHSKQGYHEL
jgi:hypothetical protein